MGTIESIQVIFKKLAGEGFIGQALREMHSVQSDGGGDGNLGLRWQLITCTGA